MSNSHSRYEQRDVNARFIAIMGIGLLILISVVLVLVSGIFTVFSERQPVIPATATPQAQFQDSLANQWQTLRATQEAQLNSYDWVDREQGIARIPIERAMDLLAEGVLFTPTPQPTATEGSGEN